LGVGAGSNNVAENIQIIGYEYKGISPNGTDGAQIVDDLTVTIDEFKPIDITVYVVYEKIEYTVVLVDFNTISLRDVYAIDNVEFDISGLKETFTNNDNSLDEYTLTNKIKITQTLSLVAKLNKGLSVAFSLTQDGSVPVETIEIDEQVISLVQDKTLYIYVIESFKTYTLTYIIQAKTDENINKKVIMANIAAEEVDVINDACEISNVEEIVFDSNVIEHKITISGLYYGDKVKLTSLGKEQTEVAEPYTYIFNKFYKDQVTNTLTRGEDHYTHTQADVNDTIYLVYGLPRVALEISWNVLSQEDFTYTVSDNTGVLQPNEGTLNEYTSGVGETLTVTVSNIKFGYYLAKYNYNGADDVNVTSLSIRVVIGASYNTLNLIFDLELYRFYFKQYGEGYKGENYLFEGQQYKNMTVEDRSAEVVLPEGMFVSRVAVNSFALEDVLTGDDVFKQENSTTDTVFNLVLTLEQLEELVKKYSKTDGNGKLVTIELTYSKHEYTLTFKFTINDGSSEFNSTIPSPTLTVVDGYNEPIASSSNAGAHNQVFTNIKYGTSVSLLVGDDLKQGLMFNTWNLSGNISNYNDDQLFINFMQTDVVAEYIVLYVPYTIKLYNYMGNGNPMVNSVAYTGNQTLKLFEGFKIDPQPQAGIRIKNIRNIAVYSYNAETWLTDYVNLFYRAEGEILRATEVYDSNKLYFAQQKLLALSDVAGNTIFNDDEFVAENYHISTITSGNRILECVCIDLEYEYIPYTVTHEVTGLSEEWLAMFAGNPIYFIEQNGGELDFTKTYSKNDVLGYNFKISERASIGDITYNLTNDVTLKSLKINNQNVQLPTSNSGIYAILFNIGEYIPQDNSTEIKVKYDLKIKEKTVTIQTQITDASFEGNIDFYIKKEGGTSQPSEELVTTREFEYLTQMEEMRAQFKKSLIGVFEVGEVNIYLDGNKNPLSVSEYAIWGITVERNETTKVVTNVKYRLGHDIRCEFIVRPKIDGFQSGQKFYKEFQCDSYGIGLPQPLTVGENKEIDVSNEFPISIEYTNSYGIIVEEPTNVGTYTATISFTGEGWMSEIGVIGSAILEISPKVISVSFDTTAPKQQKVYNGSSDYYLSTDEINSIVFDFKSLSDGKNSKLTYAVVKNWTTNTIKLSENKISSFSTTGGEVGKTASANENTHYNLYVQGLAIHSGNFALASTTFEIFNYLQIQRKTIRLVNVNVQNKVFDDTTNAKPQMQTGKAVDVVGEVEGEQLIINSSLLKINFENKEIGANKRVKVSNIGNSLQEVNCDAHNYTIEDEMWVDTTAGIYPDRVTTTIDGLGEISIINLRGLNSEDDNLITLIPINSRIEISVIYQDSPEYRNVYRVFGRNVRGNNEFAIGYSIKLMANEVVHEVSKDLYVQVPHIKHLTGAYYLTGNSSGKIVYSLSSEGILVDLQGLSVDLDKIMFTQQRILLKAWQVVLIIVLFILVIVAIILIVIIIRRKKKKDYSVHEKI